MVLVDFSRSETLAPMAWACGKFAAAAACILVVTGNAESGASTAATHIATGMLLAFALFEPAIDEFVLGSFCIFQDLRHASLFGTNLTVVRECTVAFALRQYSYFCETHGHPPEPTSFVWVCASSGLWFLSSTAFTCSLSSDAKHSYGISYTSKLATRYVSLAHLRVLLSTCWSPLTKIWS
jgi:hypothetical protein